MIRHTAFLGVLFGLGLHTSVFGEIINVPGDQPTIQAAIDAATDGDEIVVAPGTYFENINLLGKAVTLRSSDGPAVTIIDANGNGTVVLCNSDEGPSTVIDGFTITGGNATNDYPDNRGGGMRNKESSPTVTDCIFTGNSAILGGGMDNLDSSPTLIDCTFSENSAQDGGGMFNEDGSSPRVIDCTFSKNSAQLGGGMLNEDSGNPAVIGCTFSENSAAAGGGMLTNHSSNLSVINCTFSGNSAQYGGGMYNGPGGNLIVTNCMFSGNDADEQGGGMSNSLSSSPTIINCTFSGNSAPSGGGMHNTYDANPVVTNCILWNNSPTEIAGPGTPAVTYSDVQGGWPGEGNIDADPLFVDADGPDDDPDTLDDNNYRLAAGSPAIDAGGEAEQLDPCSTDLDGNDRFFDEPDTPDADSIVDMGAYEFASPAAVDCNLNGLDDICEGVGDCNDNAIPDTCDLVTGFLSCDADDLTESCDCNNNGIADVCDIQGGANPDCNSNGIPDECDIINGINEVCDSDVIDACDFVHSDCNSSGTPDFCDIAAGASEDCTGDGVPDECEPDCNNNGSADSCDIFDGGSTDTLPPSGDGIPDDCQTDCNENQIPDADELSDGTSQDCNGNSLPDECDLASGTSGDCNANTIPDECEDGGTTDCNKNNSPDFCDLLDGTSIDEFPTGGDGIPDECQSDCNENGVPDDVDIANGTSSDCDSSGVPDECQKIVDCFVTWYVDDDCVAPGSGTEADPFCTIQQAVDIAMDDHTILVAPGTYTGDGNRDISLFGKRILLKSTDGPENTIIDAENSSRVLRLIHNETPETIIEGFTIANGIGGIYIQQSSPTIRWCIIRDNSTSGRGGGVFVDGESSAIFDRCIITGNTSFNRGAGMYVGFENSTVSLRNCLIFGNMNNSGGGGFYNVFGETTIVNTTIAHNNAQFAGGVQNENGELFMSSCTVWGNTQDFGNEFFNDSFSELTIEYSNIAGGLSSAGEGLIVDVGGNIDADPLFFDPEDGDFHLSAGSPCIDAGNNLAVPEGVITDLNGGPRFLDDPSTPDTGNPDPDDPKLPIVDMGPYEFDPDDCNNNDVPDEEDIKGGGSSDIDENGIPDECQADCNENDIPDSYEISEGMSEDCDANGVPDECQPDCNENGQADACDIADGISHDCNGNGVPDECPQELPGPPITQQPVSQQVEVGEFAFFQIQADGVLLLYQWRKEGVDVIESERIIGTQTSTLVILDTEPSDTGEYDCVVTEVFDLSCSTSDPATLTVTAGCPADVNDDGVVGPVDLAMLLGAWGPCPDPDACPADLNADGVVNPLDLATLLAAWGPCV